MIKWGGLKLDGDPNEVRRIMRDQALLSAAKWVCVAAVLCSLIWKCC